MKFDDHKWMVKRLEEAQQADHDNREQSREAHLFVDKRDGQWEPYWWDLNDGKPRYTFDLVNPIVDQIMGEMREKDFDIKIIPKGTDASKETAKTYDGLIRNIEDLSNADSVYDGATKDMVTGGLSGWRLIQKYVDGDTFDQDLIIERVGNWVDRVWFGPHEEPDASDAQFCWILTGVDKEDFEEQYPEHAADGDVSSDRSGTAFFHREDLVVVGEFLYLQEEERELALMSNGQVLAVDETFGALLPEMQAAGMEVKQTRKRKVKCTYSRLFTARGWLGKPRKTVFKNYLPVIPMYANFKYIEDKVVYWGAVEKLMDPQRVFNYSLSREIEEGALAPRQKYWMTEKQAEGYEDSLARMNTDAAPVQFYNPDEQAPGPPQQTGGAQINPGLRNISESMRMIVGQAAGMFAANMGDNPGLQSGRAIEALQDRGDNGNHKYLMARERAQTHTARILIDSIPAVYEPSRQVRLLNEDGSYEMQTIGQEVQDDQNPQETRVLNDLSRGSYDVRCTAGPAFKSRQSETVSAITEIGKVDPSVIEVGADVLLSNIPTPGMDQIAERRRQMLFNNNLIPFEQMTDEEKQVYKQMQSQPPKEDPNMVLAKAEEAKAQADLVEAQTKQMEAGAEIQHNQKKVEIDAFNAETDRMRAEVERARAAAEVQGKGAQAAKHLAEAEAQDIENTAVVTGVMDLAQGVSKLKPQKAEAGGEG